MTRIVLTAIVAALAVAGIASAHTTPTLNGSVGPGFTIKLTKAGKNVTKLKAGTYRFVVSDRSPIHNFELEKQRGGEFERELTDVSATGTKTVTIKLTRGTYKYYCKPHESTMTGTFTVS